MPYELIFLVMKKLHSRFITWYLGRGRVIFSLQEKFITSGVSAVVIRTMVILKFKFKHNIKILIDCRSQLLQKLHQFKFLN